MRPSLASLIVLWAFIGLLLSCSGPNKPEQSNTEPSAFVTIDSVASVLGQTVDVSIRLRLSSGVTELDSIQSFIINVTYNDSLVRCIGGKLGEADSAWGYFAWREFPSHPPYDVRAENLIKASRPDLNRPPRRIGEAMPEGEILRLTFEVSADSAHIGRTAEISFSTTTCEANTLVDAADGNLFHMTRSNSTNDSLVFELDTLNCIRRYSLLPDLEFVSGAIIIQEPPIVTPDPRISVSIGSIRGHAGDTVRSEIMIDYGMTPPYVPPGFGGLAFFIDYDTTVLSAVDVVQGPELAGWEYFTWRRYVELLSLWLVPSGLWRLHCFDTRNERRHTISRGDSSAREHCEIAVSPET